MWQQHISTITLKVAATASWQAHIASNDNSTALQQIWKNCLQDL